MIKVTEVIFANWLGFKIIIFSIMHVLYKKKIKSKKPKTWRDMKKLNLINYTWS